jgi:hypothetical protein
MTRIQLISSPRNISTALMYSFANRGDCFVIDEPFYAYYLKTSGKIHPGREEIIRSQSNDIEVIYNTISVKDYGKKILFIKNMAKHFIQLDYHYLAAFKNVFLIRNPYQLIASYSTVVAHPEMEDIGARRQYLIYKELVEKGEKPIVLDSGEVLKNPEKVLSNLCDRLNIPYTNRMLKWEKGALAEDGVWAKFWYKNVHNSKGFQKQKTSNRTLDDSLMNLYKEARKYYDILFDHSIKAD